VTTHTPHGLIASQEVVEVRLDNSLSGSLQERIMQALGSKPEHRIISLSVFSAGEFNMYLRAIIVIEYVEAREA